MEDSGVPLDNQQPGQTITPASGSAAGMPQPAAQAVEPQAAPAPLEPATPPPPPSEPQPAADEPPAPPPAAEAGFPEIPDEPVIPTDSQPITWTASEFIAHAKSFGWYTGLAAASVALAALIFLITRDPISVGVVIFGAIIFGIYAGHPPRELGYRLDGLGLTIGQKHFGYNQFRCFSVLPEGGVSSIVFMPLKRFAMPTTIYYPPEDEDKIVNLLGSRLPLEQRGHDAVDRLMHRIHF